ncbi:helix-turn-helix domain-containing protein [Caulobacter hibisci]|uniref:Helix-turn-helix domain-containing protein n=1 Tax=Caulobacter hibisci TaxID=2035993 RepID=A0ABS0T3Q9_9CAUL|nr:helix-turn-helix domain-containing protein [Caulobacter hibisci]MBI1686469.1 helix-turn-helix domain-containing protein [Caulobacter hibisci]
MKNDDFNGIMTGLADAKAFVDNPASAAGYRVHVPHDVNVKAIRQRLGLSQAGFAARFGFPRATIADWEQQRRKPEASARVLLTIIDREPEAVERALTAA